MCICLTKRKHLSHMRSLRHGQEIDRRFGPREDDWEPRKRWRGSLSRRLVAASVVNFLVLVYIFNSAHLIHDCNN